MATEHTENTESPDSQPDTSAPDPSVNSVRSGASFAEDFSTAFFDHGLGDFEAGDFVIDEIKRERFLSQLREWRTEGWRVHVYCNNEGEIERLHDLVAAGGGGRPALYRRHPPSRLHLPRREDWPSSAMPSFSDATAIPAPAGSRCAAPAIRPAARRSISAN